MYERLPSEAFVRFAGLLTYQVFVPVAPVSVSQTRTVPAIRWPQPVVAPAAPQSLAGLLTSPWNSSKGRTKDCWSPVQAPLLLVHVAPGEVQLAVQRLRPPALLPSQKRRLVPVPTGSMRAKKPSPPVPICHCCAEGLPVNSTVLGPLSCAPPAACGVSEVAKLPLMSPE